MKRWERLFFVNMMMLVSLFSFGTGTYFYLTEHAEILFTVLLALAIGLGVISVYGWLKIDDANHSLWS